MATVEVLLQDIVKLETDAIIVGFYEDVRPLRNLAGEIDWLLCGSLSDLILKQKLRGSLGETALLTSQGKFPAQKIFMIGFGPLKAVTALSVTESVRAAVAGALNAGLTSVALECFPPLSDMPYETSIPALQKGIAGGASGRTVDVALLSPDAASHDQIARLIKS